MPKIAVISCSRNPDMRLYFDIKRDAFSESIFFFGPNPNRWALNTSTFTLQNHISWRLVPDIFITLLASLYLKFIRGSKVVIFDNVHITNGLYSIWLYLLRVKQVYTVHDQVPHLGQRSGVTAVFYHQIVRRFAGGIVLFSPDSFTGGRIPSIEVRLAGFSRRELRKSDPQDVLIFGRMEQYKGLNFLVDFSEQLRRISPQSRVKVVGKWASWNGAQELKAQLHAAPNVALSDNKYTTQDLLEKSASCAVALLPYQSATQSGVLIEALSLGLVPVIFDSGSLVAYLGDHRELVAPVGDVATLVRNAVNAISNYSCLAAELARNHEVTYGRERAVIEFKKVVGWCHSL